MRKKKKGARPPQRGPMCRETQRDRYEERSSDREGSTRKADNDISWYSRYPNLLLGAGQLQYPYRPGMSLNFGNLQMVNNQGTFTHSTNNKAPIPGVMVLDWAPSVGLSTNDQSPASVVCRDLFAKIRSAYSSDLDIDAPDVFIYLQALDSVFAYIATLKRIYRVVAASSPDNYVVPNMLMNALGFTDTQAKLA